MSLAEIASERGWMGAGPGLIGLWVMRRGTTVGA
jgi:hypothetical protein